MRREVDEESRDDSRESAPSVSLGSAWPARIGRFKVHGIDRDSSGNVRFRAVDPVDDQPVSVRLCRGSAGMGASELQRLAGVCHPNLQPVLDSGPCGGRYYVATPAGPATSLHAWLDDGPVAPWRAAEVVAAVADALDVLHREGFAHGSVHPDTIRLTTGGAPQLDRPAPATGRATDDERLAPFVAPECWERSDEAAGPATDQFALGVVLYLALCGRPPVVGDARRVRQYVCQDDPIPPRVFWPGVPRAVERVCLKAVAREPADRYASCAEFARAVRSAARAARTFETTARAARWVRERPTAVRSAAWAAVGLVATSAVVTALAALGPLDTSGRVPVVAVRR